MSSPVDPSQCLTVLVTLDEQESLNLAAEQMGIHPGEMARSWFLGGLVRHAQTHWEAS